MKLLLGTGLFLTRLLLAGSAAADASTAYEAALRYGSIRVVAQLTTPTRPEGDLPDRAAVSSQRRAIARAQRGVTSRMQREEARVVRAFETIPYLALEVDADGLAALARDPEVLQFTEDRIERATLKETVPLIGADRAAMVGLDGHGWTIAIIDTGLDASHPFLVGKAVSEACYSARGSCPNGQSSQIGAGAGAACTYAKSCAHGTHVAGIAVGSADEMSGVASGADLISLQVFSRFDGTECQGQGEDPCTGAFVSDQIAALERVFALHDVFQIAAVNISIGGTTVFSSPHECDSAEAPRKAIISNLLSVGISTIVASGNGGSSAGLTTPACITEVISVGATNDADEIAAFSNSATFLGTLAPGVGVTSSQPGGRFKTMSGTSMAAPHVAGAIAVLRQAAPLRRRGLPPPPGACYSALRRLPRRDSHPLETCSLATLLPLRLRGIVPRCHGAP